MKTIAALTIWAALAGVLSADTVNKPIDMEAMVINAIYAGAATWGVDPLLLLEICRRESSLQWWAMGDHHHKVPQSFGICGVKATTASAILKRVVMGWQLMDPFFGATLGAQIFRACLDQHNGNKALGVDCYRGVRERRSPLIRRRRKDDRTVWILNRWGETTRRALWSGDLRLVRR